MNETYSWTSRDGSHYASATLMPDGIDLTFSNEKRFERYDGITHVQLMPAAGNDGVGVILRYSHKVAGMYQRDIIWGPRPPVDAMNADAFNQWLLALHCILVARGQSDRTTFKCGAAMNTWGWLFYVTPIIRVVALSLVPIGLIAAAMTRDFAFALMCVGGGAALLATPKVKRPDLPERMRRIGPYDPQDVPAECLATVSPEAA